MPKPLETFKYAEILARLETIELAEKEAGRGNKRNAAWAIVTLADQLGATLNEHAKVGTRCDQEDLATLVLIDQLARDIENLHDPETGPIADEEPTPSQITGRILSRAVRHWIP